MTVQDCIEEHKKHHRQKIKRLWICPGIVKHPRVGEEYMFNGTLDSRLDDDVKELPVKLYWTEDNKLCIIYDDKAGVKVFANSTV